MGWAQRKWTAGVALETPLGLAWTLVPFMPLPRHRETPGVPVCWRQEVRTPPGELEGVGPQELSSSSLGAWDPGSGPRNSFSSNCTAGARGRCAHPSAVGKQGRWEKAWSQRPDEVLASLSSEWEWGWGQGCSKGQTDSWAGKLQLLRFGTILSLCECEHSSLPEAWALEPGESEESCDPVLSCPATWGRDPELPSPFSSALKRVVLSF